MGVQRNPATNKLTIQLADTGRALDPEYMKRFSAEAFRSIDPAEQESRLQELQILRDNIKGNAKMIVDSIPDDNLDMVTPEDKAQIKQGVIPKKFITEEMHPDIKWWDRFRIKNFGSHFGAETPEAAASVFFDKEKYPKMQTIVNNGRIFVKNPKDPTWYPMDADPDTNLPGVLGKLFGAASIAGLAGFTVGGLGGLLGSGLVDSVVAKSMLKDIDWEKEKKALKQFASDLPYDFGDHVTDVIKGALTAAASGAGATAGAFTPAGPLVGGSIAGAGAAGVLEATQNKLGQALGLKQKISWEDILMSGAMTGALNMLVGAQPAREIIAKKAGPIADAELKKMIPEYAMQRAGMTLTADQENVLFRRSMLADSVEQAANDVLDMKTQLLTDKAVKEAQGIIPKVYQGFTRGVMPEVATITAGAKPAAYVNYIRNPKVMLELDNSASEYAGKTGRDLLTFATDNRIAAGTKYGDALEASGKLVDMNPVKRVLSDKIIDFQQRKMLNDPRLALNGIEEDQLSKLQTVYDKFFKVKINEPQIVNGQKVMVPTVVDKPSVMTAKEALSFKQDLRDLARYDIVDARQLQDPIQEQIVTSARGMYSKVNEVLDQALPETAALRRNVERKNLQEDFVRSIFPEDSRSGNLLFDQKAYEVLTTPDSKSHVVLSEFLDTVDRKLGLTGENSYKQRTTNLWSHSYLGNPETPGYTRYSEKLSGNSLVGASTAAVAKTVNPTESSQSAYAGGKLLGWLGVTPENWNKLMGRGYAAENLISSVIDSPKNVAKFIGKKISPAMTNYVEQRIPYRQSVMNTILEGNKAVLTDSPWLEIPDPRVTDQPIEEPAAPTAQVTNLPSYPDQVPENVNYVEQAKY